MTASLRDTAYARIRELLLNGVLPPGTHLSARTLGKHLGMSLIPVREAIGQLAHEGLVRHVPGRGAFVHWPTASELEELYEIREALECHAASVAIDRIQPETIATMRRCNAVLEAIVAANPGAAARVRREDSDRWVQADAELHIALLGATGNRRMVEFVGNLRTMAQVFGGGRGGHVDSAPNRERIVREHAALIGALEQHDGDRAQAVLSEHIRTGLTEARRLMTFRLMNHGRDGTVPELAGLLGRASRDVD
ncbi:MAG: GntR family transcriptional regulator [Planctomycetes bacterium]|nr:GntR family transcriptional regulator [Planctomycetota bacterium]